MPAMSLMLRLQLGAILISLATAGWLLVVLRADTAEWRLALAVQAAFNLWWIGSVAWLRITRRVVPDMADAWYGHTLAVFWFGNVATVGTFWLLMPAASPVIQALAVFFSTGPVAVEAMGSVRPPRFGPRSPLSTAAPVGIPAGEAAYFVVHGGELALPVILFWPAFVTVVLLLRENLQRSLVKSHELRIAAEQAGEARTRFLAAASHDLGQPLQSARLFLDQSLRSADPERRRRALDNARDALGAMERLLTQMLDHLRLGAGAIRPHPRPLIASEPIARVAAQFEPVAALAGVSLVAAPSSLALTADTDLLERALGNLVDNALRHAKARRVLIGARRSGDAVRFWVVDNGRGVAAEERERLFDDYVQGGDAGGGERGGFGLGLASVRRMAGLMGGRAALDPGWRKGAAFFIEVPLGGTEGAAA
jgi:signal transduction histidine kinase